MISEASAANIRPERRADFRARLLQRNGGLCERCSVKKATLLHHLTYERAGEELDMDVLALCRSCHRQWHGQDGGELVVPVIATQMPRIAIRVPPSVKASIIEEARKAERGPSDFLRRFLVKHFPPKGGKRDA